ncbi:tRNA 2-thiocytidine(32) synthetase TtcA, partial [Xanthomonas perforans]
MVTWQRPQDTMSRQQVCIDRRHCSRPCRCRVNVQCVTRAACRRATPARSQPRRLPAPGSYNGRLMTAVLPLPQPLADPAP